MVVLWLHVNTRCQQPQWPLSLVWCYHLMDSLCYYTGWQHNLGLCYYTRWQHNLEDSRMFVLQIYHQMEVQRVIMVILCLYQLALMVVLWLNVIIIAN